MNIADVYIDRFMYIFDRNEKNREREREKTNRSQTDSDLRTDKHFTTKGFSFFF